jgi:hypothetical protein
MEAPSFRGVVSDRWQKRLGQRRTPVSPHIRNNWPRTPELKLVAYECVQNGVESYVVSHANSWAEDRNTCLEPQRPFHACHSPQPAAANQLQLTLAACGRATHYSSRQKISEGNEALLGFAVGLSEAVDEYVPWLRLVQSAGRRDEQDDPNLSTLGAVSFSGKTATARVQVVHDEGIACYAFRFLGFLAADENGGADGARCFRRRCSFCSSDSPHSRMCVIQRRWIDGGCEQYGGGGSDN